MDQMAERVKWGTSNARRLVAVMLDDGYNDNLCHACPVFKKNGVPFTVYVAPGFIDGSAVVGSGREADCQGTIHQGARRPRMAMRDAIQETRGYPWAYALYLP